ncbi:possible tyrosine transporter P-protein [Micromonospora echinaurantiaca]|uniref:Possible tyrosine transporter P-protein n=1 Tax=Micromonospora echinaurantiaca TaxID=47857 RepID=A0A1C5HW71_9ACTN|nr:possible tyrosine transporter P-protein [Micromonospora echinaurantiaca]
MVADPTGGTRDRSAGAARTDDPARRATRRHAPRPARPAGPAPVSAWPAIAATVIFAVAFMFIATEKINRVAVVLGAAGLMALLGLVPGSDVFYSHHAGIDWDVIFLLFGMMIIVGVVKQTGVFEFLAIWAAQRSQGRPYRLMALLVGITGLASPFLDNVTTVMLVAPITISVCRRLGISAVPYLIAEVLASNIAGAATLIGDPPNIIIGSRAGLSFNDFLVHMAPITLVMFLAFLVLARFMFRKSFEYHPERFAAVRDMDARAAITDAAMLTRCLVVLVLVMVGFGLHTVTGVDVAVVALLGAGVMVLVTRADSARYLAEVEWPTLTFFLGLFVMVAGLTETGVIEQVGQWATGAIGDSWFAGATSLVFGSAVLGAFFDNIPYTATMAPIVADIASQADPQTGQALWWSFALGADLGGNGTAVAASANIVVLGIAARAGEPISFWQFTRYGIATTVLTTLIAWGYVWLRYFA